MPPELLARLVDASQAADPTLVALVRLVNALAHNNAVLLGEIERLTTDLRRRDGPPPPEASTTP